MNRLSKGQGWNNLIDSGLTFITQSLISGRKVCLVETDTYVGESVIQKVRDELLRSLRQGVINDIQYENCLSRLYLHQGSILPDHFSQDLLIIHLSFIWSIEYKE